MLEPSGRFVRKCTDKAVMFPLLELAGERSVFVDEVLYVYNPYLSARPYEPGAGSRKWLTRCTRSALSIRKPRPSGREKAPAKADASRAPKAKVSMVVS